MGIIVTAHRHILCLILTLSWLLVGCNDDDDNPTEPADTVTGHWETEYVRDYQYLEGRIFDLAYPGEIGPFDSVSVWAYKEDWEGVNPAAESTYLDVGLVASNDLWDRSGVRMQEIVPDQFEILYGLDTSHCPVALVFYEERSRLRALGVLMIIKRFSSIGTPTGEVDTIGYVGPEPDTLRMIQPTLWDNVRDNPAWQLMWRNCYQVRQNADISDLSVSILKCPTGDEGTSACLDYQIVQNAAQSTYLRILGLDQYNRNALKIPDGYIDERVEILRSDWGLIIFPEREPFNSNRTFEDAVGNRTDTLAVKVPTLYNYTSITEKMENSVYYLELKYWIRDQSDR